MPEPTPGPLPDFPDLATPVARETVPPPFEQVVARARRRRRRQVLATAAVTAAALATVVTGTALTTGHQDTVPRPTKPSAGPTATATPIAVDAARIVLTGDLVSYASGPDGSLLTVWQKCADEAAAAGCSVAWQLQTTTDTFQGLLEGDVPVARAAGGAYVLSSWDRGAVVVDLTGHERPVTRVDSGTVAAGDVFVHRAKGLVAVDPGTATSWSVGPAPDGGDLVQAEVAADGTTWAMSLSPRPRGGSVLWHRGPGETTWQRHPMPADHPNDSLPGYLAVAGDRVAALSGFDGATVLPVADLAITADAGSTWTDLHQGDLPFRYVDAMAATSGGTLYVVTPGGEHLYRSVDASWTRFAEVPNPQRADTLVPAGERVLARGGTATQPTLSALDDAGRSTPVSLAR